MSKSSSIEIYRLPISTTYRNGDHIEWPLVDKEIRRSQQMLATLIARAQPIFGDLVQLEPVERADDTSVSLIVRAHLEEQQLELIPEIQTTVTALFSEACEALNLIAASTAQAAEIAIRAGNPADSTDTTIYARAPVAELAQILREYLPAGAQPGADLGMVTSPVVTPPRGISGRLRDEAEEILVAEIMHVCDHSRTALVKADNKLKKITFPPEHRTELLHAQLEFITLNLQVSTNYKFFNGVKKASGYTLLRVVAAIENPQQQQLKIQD